MKEFFEGFKEFGHNLNLIVNSVLLGFVYLMGVGLTSIISKVLGKRFLDAELEAETYWDELNLGNKNLEEYYRQF